MPFHFCQYDNLENIISFAGMRRTLLVSDSKVSDLPDNVQFYDINNFNVLSWSGKLNLGDFSICIIRIRVVSAALQHAFHIHTHSHTYVLLERESDREKLQLDIPYRYHIVLCNAENHKQNHHCEPSMGQLSQIVAVTNPEELVTTDEKVRKLLPQIVYTDRKQNLQNKTCITSDLTFLQSHTNCSKIVLLACNSALPAIISYLSQTLLGNSALKSYMSISDVKIGSAKIPEVYAYQVLLHTASVLKNKLEELYIFLDGIPLKVVSTEKATTMHLFVFNFTAYSDTTSATVKERTCSCALQCLRYMHEAGFIDNNLVPNIDKIRNAGFIAKLLYKVYGTTEYSKIEEIKVKHINNKMCKAQGVIRDGGGNATLDFLDPYEATLHSFQSLYCIKLEDMFNALEGVADTSVGNAGFHYRMEHIHRKLPDTMAAPTSEHCLYTFGVGNTGILCGRSFKTPCAATDARGNTLTITPRCDIVLTEDELKLVGFYQVIFFTMHWSTYPSKKQQATYHYYVVPLCKNEQHEDIDWEYMENLYNNFLLHSVQESTENLRNLIWNPFSRVFMLYVDDHDQPIETVLDSLSICEHLENTYKVVFQQREGYTLFKAICLGDVISKYKKMYSSIISSESDEPTKMRAIEELGNSVQDLVDTKSRIIDAKEACFITNLKPTILQEYAHFISIFGTFELACHAYEVGQTMGADMPLSLIIEAIAPKDVNPYLNYERLEFLGDSVLKMITTCIMSVSHASIGDAILAKDLVISNRALAEICKTEGIYKNISLIRYHQKMVQPPHLQNMQEFEQYFQVRQTFISDNLGGYLKSLNDTRLNLDRKVYADVIEALIGATMLVGGVDAVLNLLYRLGILKHVCDGVPPQGCSLKSIFTAEEHTPWTLRAFQHRNNFKFEYIGVLSADSIRSIEDFIGYSFEDPVYLEKALIHPSFTDKRLGSEGFQFLELLGDAVIDIFVACRVYNDKRLGNPEDLHIAKFPYVSNQTFALIVTHTILSEHIKIGFRSGLPGQKLSKAYSDIFEALAGAIFCDLKWDFDKFIVVMRRKLLTLMETFKTAPDGK